MKNTPLQFVIEEVFDRMFVVDKRGVTVFFPWGDTSQGYLLKSKSLVAKVKKFYISSFFICVVVFVIAASIFHSYFWAIVGSVVISFGCWYLVYFLYVSSFVGSLPVAKASYSEIALEKLESENEEEFSQSDVHFPVHWNQTVPQRKWNIIAQIQHIWYRLSPGQIFMICFFIGIFTALIWSTYRPEQVVDADYLVGFFVCFIVGYGGFIVTQSMESVKADWYGFIKWKLPFVMTTVGCWSMAAWLLYKFVALIVT